MTGPLPRAIVIKPDPFGNRWDVEVLPPLTEGASFDQDFSCIKRARGYAAGLRMSLGYKVTDLCVEPGCNPEPARQRERAQ